MNRFIIPCNDVQHLTSSLAELSLFLITGACYSSCHSNRPLCSPTPSILGRFIPPWEKEGRKADDFFKGILRSRNPYERHLRDTQRINTIISQDEEKMAENQLQRREEDLRRAKEDAEERVRERAARKFLPYGSKPVQYYADGFAAWGQYVSSLEMLKNEGMDSAKKGIAKKSIVNDTSPMFYSSFSTMGTSTSTSEEAIEDEESIHQKLYHDPVTTALLAADMDTNLPYKYDTLPLIKKGQKGTDVEGRLWPFHGTCGIALDIDGVVYRSKEVIKGSDEAIKTLQKLKIPFIFVTNGGGFTEGKKVEELTEILQLEEPILEDQIIMNHTPMHDLLTRHAEDNILVIGRYDSCEAARAYGFRHATSSLEYQALHPELVPFKDWENYQEHKDVSHLLRMVEDGQQYQHDSESSIKQKNNNNSTRKVIPITPANTIPHIPFGAIFVMEAPTDAFQDIQVIIDVALSPQGRISQYVVGSQTVPIYFGNDDLIWATKAPLPRLGLGAFREMLCAVFLSVTGKELEITQYGKPRAITFAFAERQLACVSRRLGWASNTEEASEIMRSICMVGDNLETDILGANAAGGKWLSVHVLSGVGSAPAAVRTVSPDDREMLWMLDFIQKTENVGGGGNGDSKGVDHHQDSMVIPHYVAPTLDHFVREALAFGEGVVTGNKNTKKYYGMPNPVNLEDEYCFLGS